MFGLRIPAVLFALALRAAVATRPWTAAEHHDHLHGADKRATAPASVKEQGVVATLNTLAQGSLVQSSGAATRKSEAACRNDDGEAMLREVSRNGEGVTNEFKEEMKKVAKSYALKPFAGKERFVKEFQSKVMSVSDDCARCFLEMFTCTAANCKKACMPSTPWASAEDKAKKDSECSECRDSKCECAFTTCAGSTFRTLGLSSVPPPVCGASLLQVISHPENTAPAVPPATHHNSVRKDSLTQLRGRRAGSSGSSGSAGACRNPADESAARAAWGTPTGVVPENIKKGMKSVAMAHALPSFGFGKDKDPSVKKFQSQVMRVSDECAQCYLDNFSCTASNCKMQCMPSSLWAKGDAVKKHEEQCDECRIRNCECELMDCAGSTFSTLGLSPQTVPECTVDV